MARSRAQPGSPSAGPTTSGRCATAASCSPRERPSHHATRRHRWGTGAVGVAAVTERSAALAAQVAGSTSGPTPAQPPEAAEPAEPGDPVDRLRGSVSEPADRCLERGGQVGVDIVRHRRGGGIAAGRSDGVAEHPCLRPARRAGRWPRAEPAVRQPGRGPVRDGRPPRRARRPARPARRDGMRPASAAAPDQVSAGLLAPPDSASLGERGAATATRACAVVNGPGVQPRLG